MKVDSENGLKRIGYEKTSHQELPYLIHAGANVPYLVGKHGHTIIAVELKKFGWKISLVKNDNEKYIVARKGREVWAILVITAERRLSDVLRNLKENIDNQLEPVAQKLDAIPVVAVIAQDSVALISARSRTGLSPRHEHD
ncbi:MAG: hypothetical protein QXU32_03560 [Nitrososphaerales archaeon]